MGTGCVPRIVPNLTSHIGQGTTGKIYSMVSEHGPVAIKFQEHSMGHGINSFRAGSSFDVPMNAFEQEVAIHLIVSSWGLAPKIYASCSPSTKPYGEGDYKTSL